MFLSRTERMHRNEICESFERVWVLQARSLEDEARRFEAGALCARLLSLLSEMENVVEELPLRAFGPQADDVDGSDVWSAGEIIGHLAEVEIDALSYWESAAGRRLTPPSGALLEAANRPPSNRQSVLNSVRALREHATGFYPSVSDSCHGEQRAVHFALGQVTVRAALLGTCLHALDHLRQLESLGGPT